MSAPINDVRYNRSDGFMRGVPPQQRPPYMDERGFQLPPERRPSFEEFAPPPPVASSRNDFFDGPPPPPPPPPRREDAMGGGLPPNRTDRLDRLPDVRDFKRVKGEQRMCKNFESGSCRFGPNCQFVHVRRR